ncbi:MAG: hypothetical protein AB1758_23910 [Candidatus Eremiobacterota bacterium]
MLIDHRDMSETMALTTVSHLRSLQAQIGALRKQLSRPFKLAGSIQSELSDRALDTALADLRKGQAELAERKLREFDS